MEIDPESIPRQLRDSNQWVCWTLRGRNKKLQYLPLDPETLELASVVDPTTWTTFETALAVTQSESTVHGVGFVFTYGNPIVGISLDECRDRDSGQAEPWAQTIINRLDSYTEINHSGTGYQIYVEGVLPEGQHQAENIELNATDRFFPVTGDSIAGTPIEICERPTGLDRVLEGYVIPNSVSKDSPYQRQASASLGLSDEEVISQAQSANNGAIFEQLWYGDTSGCRTQREADLLLCSLLAFWTGGDEERIDDLFRQSELYREAWDEDEDSGLSTYGWQTIETAVRLTGVLHDIGADGDTTDEIDSTAATLSSSTPSPESLVKLGLVGDLERLTHQLKSLQEGVSVSRSTTAELTKKVSQLESQYTGLYHTVLAEQQRHEELQAKLDALEQSIASSDA